MAIVGDVTQVRGRQIISHTFAGLVSGEATDQMVLGGWPELITAYFVWPAGLTAGAARLIVAHDATYTGDWEVYGSDPISAADAVRTIQVPGQGVVALSVRVTTPIVTSPTGGTLSVVIVGS